MASALLNRTRGRWREILLAFGLDEQTLSGDNTPCPLCGGTDRFFYSDLHACGSYHCRQCGGGNGYTFLRKLKGWDDATAMRELEQWLGRQPAARAPAARPEKTEAELISAARRLISLPSDPSIVEAMLAARGLSAGSSVLRGLRRCKFWEFKLPHLNGLVFEAVLAPITAPHRGVVDVQRLYHSTDIPAEYRKKSLPGRRGDLLRGAAVRLFEPDHGTLAVCEGVVTALSFTELFGVPAWAALSTWGLEHWRWPPGTRNVLIGADNDANGAGQRAAQVLARRLEAAGITVEIELPPDIGADWNDILRRRP